MTEALEQVAGFADLGEVPFTDRLSRLLVLRTADGRGLRLHTAEYERHLSSCVLLPALRVTSPGGAAVPVLRARPDRLELADGAGTLVFANPGTLSLGLAPGAWTVTLGLPDAELTASGGHWHPGLPSATHACWRIAAAEHHQRPAGDGVRIEVSDPGGAQLLIGVTGQGGARLPAGLACRAARHGQLLDEAERRWNGWFSRLPAVRPHLTATARAAWWTLAANTVRLRYAPAHEAVVPSKLGYVGCWNWDAYFIAAGLRHGAPDLARAQLEIVLDHQRADGMLVDVVHDTGVLAQTGELPSGDLRALAAHFATAEHAAAPGGPAVPVTKPPLTAWAVNLIHEASPDNGFLEHCYAPVRRSQRWWLRAADSDGDGLAEYLHPYSSGLDNSPVFDYGTPAATPDLNAYLATQFDELAVIASQLDRAGEAARLHAAAQRHVRRLRARQWDAAARRFRPLVRGRLLDVHTITDLLPLLTGRLPRPDTDVMVADLTDPAAFGGYPAVPTVSRADKHFAADRMWRGPVWLNTNRLLIDGLRRSGYPGQAQQLAEKTMKLVTEGNGMHEYWNVDSGARGSRAATMFSWSAALFIDLAITAETSGP